MKKKIVRYKPSDASAIVNEQGNEQTNEQIALETDVVENGKKGDKLSLVQKLSVVWTVLSTLYAIVSTCLFLSKKWVESAYSYVLVAMLAVFVAVFVALVVLAFKNPKNAKINIKTYKKTLGIFKGIVNVTFFALTAVSMAGLAKGDMSLAKWIVFGASFFVALVQLALKIVLFAMKLASRAVAKKFKVEVHNYVDGKQKRKSALDKVKEHSYKQ